MDELVLAFIEDELGEFVSFQCSVFRESKAQFGADNAAEAIRPLVSYQTCLAPCTGGRHIAARPLRELLS
jgi:hypothetical protein